MATRTGTGVFKSASTGVLRGGFKQETDDPLQAVLNRSWNKPTPVTDLKKTSLASRRVPQPEKAKNDELRSRLAHAGAGLVVDTSKRGLFEMGDSSPRTAGIPESPPLSALLGTAKSTDKQAEQGLKYAFALSTTVEESPRLRSPPPRRGSVKLNFDEDLQKDLEEHGLSVIEDVQKVDKEQQHFVELAHRLESLVSQTAVRMNDMVDMIRKKFQGDAAWLERKDNYDQLTEISFEVLTANYYLVKWHHQLEPRKVTRPLKPEKIEDMPCVDLLAQLQNSISKMEVVASQLGPVINKIIHDAKHLRRGPDGEPISPNSRNPVKLAAKRGFKDVLELHHLIDHLEHTLAVTHHLTHPPKSGMETFKVKGMGNVMLAALKFKKGMHKNDVEGKKEATKEAFGAAFKSLGVAVEKKLEDPTLGSTGIEPL
jgi:hypothetical protein